MQTLVSHALTYHVLSRGESKQVDELCDADATADALLACLLVCVGVVWRRMCVCVCSGTGKQFAVHICVCVCLKI